MVSRGSRSNSISSWIPKWSRISASVGFSTKENTRPAGSVSITPYFSATSAGARVMAAIVTTAPDSRCVRTIGSRSKSISESVGKTRAVPPRSQYSSIRSVESALPFESESNLTGEYMTSTPASSP